MIATPIFGKAQPLPDSTNYPHTRRINELFRASLENPVSPYVVGEKIREIVDRRFPTTCTVGTTSRESIHVSCRPIRKAPSS